MMFLLWLCAAGLNLFAALQWVRVARGIQEDRRLAAKEREQFLNVWCDSLSERAETLGYNIRENQKMINAMKEHQAASS